MSSKLSYCLLLEAFKTKPVLNASVFEINKSIKELYIQERSPSSWPTDLVVPSLSPT